MLRSPVKEDALLLLWIVCAACGDKDDDSASVSESLTSVSTPSTGCVGDTCLDVPTTSDGGATTEAVDPTSGGSGDGSSGEPDPSTSTTDDATTGPPPACAFAPGCHKPAALPGDRGQVSDVPLGCDGGAFAAPWSIGVGASGIADPEAPRSIPMLADFDADGTIDLFLNMRKAGAAYVLRGLGDGTFDLAAPAILSGGLFAGGWGGDVGDFNQDGTLDVLVGDHVRGAYAWTGGPGLTFTAAITGLPPASELFSGGGLADFDGDGDLDAVFGKDQFGKGYALAHGDGAGGWTMATAPMSAMATNIGHFQFADYDADGQIDIFGFGEGGAVGLNVYVYHNDGGGGFTEVTSIPSGPANQLNADPVQGSIGDIDCDGQIDIAAGGSIYLNQGGAWALVAAVDDAHIGHLADMNGDGHLDIVTQDPSIGLAMHLGDGTGMTWTPAGSGLPDATYTFDGVAMDTAYGIDVGDIDGDENLDVVRVAGFATEYAVEAWVR